MIIYENKNVKLLIEEGEQNLALIFLSKYLPQNTSLYLSEQAALNLYNNYYKHELSPVNVISNGKKMTLIPVIKNEDDR